MNELREALKECISQLIPFAEDGDQPAINAAIDAGRKALAVTSERKDIKWAGQPNLITR